MIFFIFYFFPVAVRAHFTVQNYVRSVNRNHRQQQQKQQQHATKQQQQQQQQQQNRQFSYTQALHIARCLRSWLLQGTTRDQLSGCTWSKCWLWWIMNKKSKTINNNNNRIISLLLLLLVGARARKDRSRLF